MPYTDSVTSDPRRSTDWGGVNNEFHEFVLIGGAGELTLVVAADD
jgi:hypothetical protein